MKVKVVTEMDYDEFDELVMKSYPGTISECVADNEWSNDESHSFKIDPKDKIKWSEYDEREWQEFLSGKAPMWRAYMLFEHLVYDGYLLDGEYIINISW
jgi:hypothetical protein